MEKGCHLRGTGIHIKAAEVCVFALLRVLQTLIFSLFFSMWRRSLFSHPPPRQPPLSYRSVLQLGSLSSATEMCLRNTPSHPHVSTLPQNETLHWQDRGDSSGEIWKISRDDRRGMVFWHKLGLKATPSVIAGAAAGMRSDWLPESVLRRDNL